MQTEIELKTLFNDLISNEIGTISVGGFTIDVQVNKRTQALLFATPVYLGGNYIPQGVRKGIESAPYFAKEFTASSLVVDEEQFSIILKDEEALSSINNPEIFVQLIEDFVLLADNWRQLLDERDQNDRVYAPAL